MTKFADETEFAQAQAVLGTVSTLLDTVDWDQLAATSERADALGPILDPTAYHDALSSGRLHNNRRAIAATQRYLAELRKIHGDVSGG